MKPNKEEPETIAGFLKALVDKGFIYKNRVKIEEDLKGKEVGRKLIQIWFIHPRLMDITRRFVSDFILVIDGTFNTNKERLPLLIAVGVLNSEKTFPIAFSWCPSEDKVSYVFFWECLKEYGFERLGEPHTVPSRVILGDQNGGLTASIPNVFSDAQQQFCTWHAVEAIYRKLRELGILYFDFKFYKDIDGNKIKGIRKHC